MRILSDVILEPKQLGEAILWPLAPCLTRGNGIQNIMNQKSYTYILFSKRNGTLYIGVTSNLKARMLEHKSKIIPGFTQKYGVDKLGYFEEHTSIVFAIQREKKLKRLHRRQKIQMIESMNPEWRDLFD